MDMFLLIDLLVGGGVIHFEELIVPFQCRFDRVDVLRIEWIEQRILGEREETKTIGNRESN